MPKICKAAVGASSADSSNAARNGGQRKNYLRTRELTEEDMIELGFEVFSPDDQRQDREQILGHPLYM